MMKLRYEKKYLVPIQYLSRLRARFLPFLRPDKFTLSLENDIPQYTVRSIYYDSFDSSSFFEKIEGLKDRKKMRIRGYGNQGANAQVVLEIKRKLEDRVMKNRAFVPYCELSKLVKTGNIEGLFDPSEENSISNASRFLFNIKRYNLKPENLIVYDREAYHGQFNSGVRVTFDKNIRQKPNPKLKQLYTDYGLNPIWKGNFILEVKYFDDVMPSWARSIVEEFGLKNEALSKFTKGVEYSMGNF